VHPIKLQPVTCLLPPPSRTLGANPSEPSPLPSLSSPCTTSPALADGQPPPRMHVSLGHHHVCTTPSASRTASPSSRSAWPRDHPRPMRSLSAVHHPHVRRSASSSSSLPCVAHPCPVPRPIPVVV